VLGEKPFPVQLCLPEIPHKMTPGSSPGLGSKMSVTNPYGLSVCVYVCTYLYMYNDIFFVRVFRSNTQNF